MKSVIERLLREKGLDDRQLKEVKWAEKYAEKDNEGNPLFAHGTAGHNQLLVIAKLIEIIDAQYWDSDR